jgi:uncharacterized RmlC-like cupin family protein
MTRAARVQRLDVDRGIVTVRPTETFISKQGLPNFKGISTETAGSEGLCLHLVEIPPGGEAIPHFHDGFETAIYLLEGRVETRYGEGLRQSVVNQAGDFLFIPPGVRTARATSATRHRPGPSSPATIRASRRASCSTRSTAPRRSVREPQESQRALSVADAAARPWCKAGPAGGLREFLWHRG